MTELPEAGPGPDLRAGAFVGALDRIEAAQKLKTNGKGRVVDPLPELYWATMLEAAVLAHLATADEDPGRDAGRHTVDRAEQIQRNRDRVRDAIRRARRVDETEPTSSQPPFAEGRRVRVTRGDFAGRTGTVNGTYFDNEPAIVDVALDMRDLSDPPVTVVVRVADLELTPPAGAESEHVCVEGCSEDAHIATDWIVR